MSDWMDHEASSRARDIAACDALLRRLHHFHGPNAATDDLALVAAAQATEIGRMEARLTELAHREAVALGKVTKAETMAVSNVYRGQKVKAVIAETCDRFLITKTDLTGDGRTTVFVNARRYATRLLRDEVGLSFAAIGRVLGGKDHTTAFHSYQTAHKADEWLALHGAMK